MALQKTMYTDACCYHATLSTVLQAYGYPEPAVVLGNGAMSNARLENGQLYFTDRYPDLAAMCRQRGFICTRRSATTYRAWETTVARLGAEYPVIGVLDTFYLPHYWPDYQKLHSQHTVVLWSYDEVNHQVDLTDPSEIIRFEGTTSLADLQLAWAWNGKACNSAWIDLDPATDMTLPSATTLLVELQSHTQALMADKAQQLSCVNLARYIRSRLDWYLNLVCRANEIDARQGDDSRRRRLTRFLRGLWNYHHTLRWLAKYIDAVSHTQVLAILMPFAHQLNRIAQSWLVFRGLLLKYGLSTPDRKSALAQHCVKRIEQIIHDTQILSTKLLQQIMALLDNRAVVGNDS